MATTISTKRSAALPYAFHTAVCTQDLGRATKLARAIDATAVVGNDHSAFLVDWMPFAERR